MEFNHRAFYSGDVLLSHGLSPYYHRGCSVSLPCSEWERVGPLRYLSPEVRAGLALEPHWRLCCVRSDKRRRESLETISSFQRTPVSLASTYRSSFRLRTADATTSPEFYMRSFVFSDCRPAKARNGLTEK